MGPEEAEEEVNDGAPADQYLPSDGPDQKAQRLVHECLEAQPVVVEEVGADELVVDEEGEAEWEGDEHNEARAFVKRRDRLGRAGWYGGSLRCHCSIQLTAGSMRRTVGAVNRAPRASARRPPRTRR